MKIQIPRGEHFNFYRSNEGLVFPDFVDGTTFNSMSSDDIGVIQYGKNDYGVIRCKKTEDHGKYELPDNPNELFPTDRRYKETIKNPFGLFGRRVDRDENNKTIVCYDFINPFGDIISGVAFKNGKAFKDRALQSFTGFPFNVLSSIYCLMTTNAEYYDKLLFKYPDGEVVEAFEGEPLKITNIGEFSYVVEKDGKYNILFWDGSQPNDSDWGNTNAKLAFGVDYFSPFEPKEIKAHNNIYAVVMMKSEEYNLYDLSRGEFVFERGVDKIRYGENESDFYSTLAKEYSLIPVRVKSHREYNYYTMINTELVDKWMEKRKDGVLRNDILDLARWRMTTEDGRSYEKLFYTDIDDKIFDYKGEPCVNMRCGYNLYNGDDYQWKKFGLKTKTLKN